jgi:DNA-directed RNA polymerase sigma subunit (sigma70/sigma32)
VTDYILQIKVKNGPMLRAMRAAGFKTASALAIAARVEPAQIGEYLNLKRSPVNKDGSWSVKVVRIADALGAVPENLFPPQHYREVLKINSGEIEASLEDVMAYLPKPSDPLLEIERREAIGRLMDRIGGLKPREAELIKWRFGLGDNEEATYRECGDRLGVSAPRAQQIEAHALRKLQWQYGVRIQ